jgi:tRNA (cytidine/uridine-2'-O-)-methyltransferase
VAAVARDTASLHIVLVEPLIPPNTGTVGRLALAAGARLHLVEPLGFDIDDKAVRRAGLDYWKQVDLCVHRSWRACREAIGAEDDRIFLLSTHARRPYTSVEFTRGDVLVFGKETSGLGPAFLEGAAEQALGVPFFGAVRSLNLSTTVGIVVYEALRQIRPADFPGPQLNVEQV